jgi:hypothetical protein
MGWSLGGITRGIAGGIGNIGKTAGTILGGASGVSASNAGAEARKYGERSEKTAKEQLARGNAQQDVAAQSYGQTGVQGKALYDTAKAQGANYDAQVAAALGQTPEQYLAAQNAAAQGIAGQEALATTNQATKAAIKAGRTGGLMGGQAGLAAAQNAGATYAGAKQNAADAARANYAAANTQRLQGLQTQAGEMAGRQVSGIGAQQQAAAGQAGLAGQSLGAATSYQGSAGSGYGTNVQGQAAAGQNATGLLGGVAGIGANVAGIFSDRRLKEDIAPVSVGDALAHIKSYGFRYRGEDRPETGIMAQDLEGGAMAPAVIETPAGKAIDTKRLTTMNTAGLSEHEKRLRQIEAIISALADEGVAV